MENVGNAKRRHEDSILASDKGGRAGGVPRDSTWLARLFWQPVAAGDSYALSKHKLDPIKFPASAVDKD